MKSFLQHQQKKPLKCSRTTRSLSISHFNFNRDNNLILIPLENSEHHLKNINNFFKKRKVSKEESIQNVLSLFKLRDFEIRRYEIQRIYTFKDLTENEKKLIKLFEQFYDFHKNENSNVEDNFEFFMNEIKDEYEENWITIHFIVANYFSNMKCVSMANHLYHGLIEKLKKLAFEKNGDGIIQNELVCAVIYLGVNYFLANDIKNAERVFKEAWELMKYENVHPIIVTAITHYEGLCAHSKKDFASAEKYLMQSSEYAEEIQNPDQNISRLIVSGYRTLGIIQNDLKKFDEALESAERAHHFSKKFPTTLFHLDALQNLILNLLHHFKYTESKKYFYIESELYQKVMQDPNISEINKEFLEYHHNQMNIQFHESFENNREILLSYELYLAFLSKHYSSLEIRSVEFRYFSHLAKMKEHNRVDVYIANTYQRKIELEALYLEALSSCSEEDEEILKIALKYYGFGNKEIKDFIRIQLIKMDRIEESKMY